MWEFLQANQAETSPTVQNPGNLDIKKFKSDVELSTALTYTAGVKLYIYTHKNSGAQGSYSNPITHFTKTQIKYKRKMISKLLWIF